MKLKALLFDVDGTLAETEDAHRTAFNQVFAEAGRAWCWSEREYRGLLRVAGGRERLRAFVDEIGEPLEDEVLVAIHTRKNAIYAALVADGGVALRPGVARLIEEARNAGVAVAITTTTSAANLATLLDATFGPGALREFETAVTSEDVLVKKPDPEVYAIALDRLGLRADECVAIEDSRNGLEAAMTCGIPTLVTLSSYFDDEDFTGAALVRPSLDGPPPVTLADLDALSRAAEPARTRA